MCKLREDDIQVPRQCLQGEISFKVGGFLGQDRQSKPLILGKRATEGRRKDGSPACITQPPGVLPHPPYSAIHFIFPMSTPVWAILWDQEQWGSEKEEAHSEEAGVCTPHFLEFAASPGFFYGIEIRFPQPPFHLTKTRVVSQFSSCLRPSPKRLKRKNPPAVKQRYHM